MQCNRLEQKTEINLLVLSTNVLLFHKFQAGDVLISLIPQFLTKPSWRTCTSDSSEKKLLSNLAPKFSSTGISACDDQKREN